MFMKIDQLIATESGMVSVRGQIVPKVSMAPSIWVAVPADLGGQMKLGNILAIDVRFPTLAERDSVEQAEQIAEALRS